MSTPNDHADLKHAIHSVIEAFPDVSVFATLGCLDVVKFELIQSLEVVKFSEPAS